METALSIALVIGTGVYIVGLIKILGHPTCGYAAYRLYDKREYGNIIIE